MCWTSFGIVKRLVIPMSWRISICWSKWFQNGIIDPKWTLFDNWHRVVLALTELRSPCRSMFHCLVCPGFTLQMYLRRKQEQKRGWGMKLQGWGRMYTIYMYTKMLFCLASHAIVESVLELFVNTSRRVLVQQQKGTSPHQKKTEKRHGMPFIFYLSSTNPKNLPKSDRSSSLTQRGPPSFQPFLSFDATTQPHFGMPSFGLSVTFVWCAVTWLTRTVLMLVALASAFSPAGGFFRQSPTFPTDLPTKVIDFCPVNRTFFWQRALVTHNDGSNENWPLCGGNDPRGDPFFTEEWIDQRELYSFTWTWFLSKRCTTFLYKQNVFDPLGSIMSFQEFCVQFVCVCRDQWCRRFILFLTTWIDWHVLQMLFPSWLDDIQSWIAWRKYHYQTPNGVWVQLGIKSNLNIE